MIDGLRAQDGVLNPRESSSIQLSTAVYLGSPPLHTHSDLKVIYHTLSTEQKKGELFLISTPQSLPGEVFAGARRGRVCPQFQEKRLRDDRTDREPRRGPVL